MKGVPFKTAITAMNKQKNRYTPFTGKYRMPVDEFCMKYGLSLKLIMHRMNVLYWEDYDSLVIPQELGDTSADKIRRVLTMQAQNWTTESINRRLDVPVDIIEQIALMDDYKKSVFLEMDNYFFLNPAKIDLDKIFKEAAVLEGV
jgi:hypothetical protein